MASKSKQSLAVVIPMHNEELGAEKCVRTVLSVTKTLPVTTKLIVVDDGSRDKTPLILKKLNQIFREQMVVVTHQTNWGYGAGLATGIKKAQELGLTHTVFMDSDLTNDPKDLKKFVSKLNFDLVKASRYITGGKIMNVPWKRRLFSIVGNWICRISFRMGIHDYTNGFRMVRTKLLEGVEYREKGFAIILEEMYFLKHQHALCSEIPVKLTSRINTSSHFHYSLAQIWAYFKYTLKASIIL